MKALIITGRLHQDIEFQYPLYRLQEEGYEVDVAVRGKQPCAGITGLKCEPNKDIPELRVADYNVLILPGGVKAMEHVRLDRDVILFIAKYHAAGGTIGCICSGTQLLISARLVRGRKISGYYAMEDDITNAGGTFVDAPAVVDDRIICSPHYKYLGPWMRAVLDEASRTHMPAAI